MIRTLLAMGLLMSVARELPADDARPDLGTLLEKKVFTGADGGKLPYRLMKPGTVEAGQTYPLVIFLHGAGERGTDNEKQLVHGVTDFARARAKYPCYFLAPQCPEGQRWVEVDWSMPAHTMPKEPAAALRHVQELIDAVRKEYPVDAERIYATGLSMGGYGAWDLVCRRPELFAAAVVVCGGADEGQAARVKDVPVWLFHGAKDGAVLPARSRNMVQALKKAGGQPRYTEYPNVGHDSWVRAYRDPEMLAWLFAQRRGGRR